VWRHSDRDFDPICFFPPHSLFLAPPTRSPPREYSRSHRLVFDARPPPQLSPLPLTSTLLSLFCFFEFFLTGSGFGPFFLSSTSSTGPRLPALLVLDRLWIYALRGSLFTAVVRSTWRLLFFPNFDFRPRNSPAFFYFAFFAVLLFT